ncbi:hypothetical protein EUX98_g488, partial [Antrodiella citrinella]
MAPQHPPDHILPRPRNIELFSTRHVEPSPPYQRVVPPSTVLLDNYDDHDRDEDEDEDEQTPAYRSRSNVNLHEPDMGEKTRLHAEEVYEKKPSVHYPEDMAVPPSSGTKQSSFSPFESSPGSRTPSLAGTDDEDDDEDYDWSGEDDIVDEEAKFEHAMGVKKKTTDWGAKRILSLLFSSLIGSTILSGIIITPALLVHFFWFKPHPTDHRRYVKDTVEAWLFWAASNVSVSWFLGLIVDIVPTLCRYSIVVAWGHVSESMKNNMEMYNSVKDAIKPVLYAAGAWVSWVIIFEQIFDLYDSGHQSASRASYTPRLYEAVEFLFFLALVWCFQRMLSHAIAFAFHRTAFRERIEILGEALRAVERLRLYRPKRIRHSYGRTNGSVSAAFSLTPSVSSPFIEKENYGFSVVSRGGTPTNSRPGTPDRLQEVMSGNEGDLEDADATLVEKKGKKKAKGKGKSLRFTAPSEADHMTSPTTTDSPHSYPPSTANDSPMRKTNDEHEQDNVIHHAAKVLKTAVLHDARNIKGDTDENLGGLIW